MAAESILGGGKGDWPNPSLGIAHTRPINVMNLNEGVFDALEGLRLLVLGEP
jgi:hypothetical protein